MTLSSDLELLIDVDMNVVANWTARYLFGIHSGNVRDVGFDDCKRTKWSRHKLSSSQ